VRWRRSPIPVITITFLIAERILPARAWSFDYSE
jgi:hypothetical protein